MKLRRKPSPDDADPKFCHENVLARMRRQRYGKASRVGRRAGGAGRAHAGAA